MHKPLLVVNHANFFVHFSLVHQEIKTHESLVWNFCFSLDYNEHSVLASFSIGRKDASDTIAVIITPTRH
jgi:hypothetical protein